ncbi:diiron oxygenase [Kitasatospora purpeofusca]|uniref:diiron oxygenase n=1 Tax=Kitasatospora purpeofusca TaxID=67352 RepID=UPI0030F1263E
MKTAIEGSDRFREILDRLGRMSIDDYYNPYRMFEWPEELPSDQLWMSKELISLHGTPAFDELDREQLLRLARWESVNFYSLNVHGIRELLIEVVNRVHMPGFEAPSEFFHHFIGEENEHMWFFAEFCRRYGKKIYPFPRVKTTVPGDEATENFLVFARILLFEEIVDYYNAYMADDETLPETVRQVNRIHHRDESRHIAFGRELVSLLYAELKRTKNEEELAGVERYLKEYIQFCLHSFYSLNAYEDAGLEDPLAVRAAVMRDPNRRAFERRMVRKPVSFMVKSGIFKDAELLAPAAV